VLCTCAKYVTLLSLAASDAHPSHAHTITPHMPIPSPLITATELLHVTGQRAPELAVFDARFSLADFRAGKQAYLDGHVPGARYADLNRDLSDLSLPATEGRHPLPDPDRFCAWLAGHGTGTTSQFVIYDDAGGAIAARLWWMLRAQGASSVRVLDGGLSAWRAAGGLLEAGETPDTRTAHAARNSSEAPSSPEPWPACRAWPVAGRRDVLEAAAHGLLVDARDALRFAGVEEPIDPVAGHIPGAKNLPFKSLLTPDGHLLPAGALAHAWRDIAVADDSIVYCGSGVTACHLILAAAAAGLGEPRLFAPSWSGWIAQEAP